MLSEGRLKEIRESLSWDDEAQRFCPEVADLLAEIDRTRGFDQCVEALKEYDSWRTTCPVCGSIAAHYDNCFIAAALAAAEQRVTELGSMPKCPKHGAIGCVSCSPDQKWVDRIATLSQAVAELVEGIRPFAILANDIPSDVPHDAMLAFYRAAISYRRAHELVGKYGEKK